MDLYLLVRFEVSGVKVTRLMIFSQGQTFSTQLTHISTKHHRGASISFTDYPLLTKTIILLLLGASYIMLTFKQQSLVTGGYCIKSGKNSHLGPTLTLIETGSNIYQLVLLNKSADFSQSNKLVIKTQSQW
jgi:hypothetical protein